MIRVALSVEGPTEREFCQYVLTPYFYKLGIDMTPIVITTSKEKCGRKHKGGCINIDRIKNEITKLLVSFDFVSTFYDFYGFKGINEQTSIEDLEKELYELFESQKFMPYIQKYEFETLLFSKPEYYTEYFGDDKLSTQMQTIIDEFKDIENINNSRETAPSKRIEKLFGIYDEKYNKVFYGSAILQDIGLEKVRSEAKRFSEWMKKIENLKEGDGL
jgi:hypothetical protein